MRRRRESRDAGHDDLLGDQRVVLAYSASGAENSSEVCTPRFGLPDFVHYELSALLNEGARRRHDWPTSHAVRVHVREPSKPSGQIRCDPHAGIKTGSLLGYFTQRSNPFADSRPIGTPASRILPLDATFPKCFGCNPNLMDVSPRRREDERRTEEKRCA